jgi:hypothetical protein
MQESRMDTLQSPTFKCIYISHNGNIQGGGGLEYLHRKPASLFEAT